MRLQLHTPLRGVCVHGRQRNALTAAWHCLERCWRLCQHLPRGGGGEESVSGNTAVTASSCTQPRCCNLEVCARLHCRPTSAASSEHGTEGNGTSAAAPAARLAFDLLPFFFPLPPAWNPHEKGVRRGPAHLNGMMPALDRRGAGWNAAGNEAHARHLLHLPESQGSVAASPSTSCSV